MHDLELSATVSLTDFVVRSVEVRFHTYPHTECPQIAAAYQQLVGVQVGRGWTQAMRDRLGGPAGCTHLRELARSMAPVLVQAAFSARVRENPGREGDEQRLRMVLPFLQGTCHIWAAGGVGEQKLDENKRLRVHMKSHPIPERRLRKLGYNVGWYVASCPPNGRTIPLSGVVAMLQVLCGIDDGDPKERVLEVRPRLRALGLRLLTEGVGEEDRQLQAQHGDLRRDARGAGGPRLAGAGCQLLHALLDGGGNAAPFVGFEDQAPIGPPA